MDGRQVAVIEAGYRHLLPWFLPGTAVFVALGLAVARPVARLLHTRFSVAWVLIAGLGMIVSATLTPLRGQLNFAAVGGTCDLSRMGLAPLRQLLHLGDASLNVFLFIPFGAAIGLVGGSRPKAVLIVAAIALPFAIETTQLLVPALERGCQSADVFDNLTGLAVGLAFGTIGRWLTATPTANGSQSATGPD